ncbi:hypothetical protein KTO58_22925 [Chitinophaga pendula]|uniref:hypothetical protein n=1 Tax=Chitinophaga TaxID=79328 RepID=UPI000BAF8C0A|nr:MULTISPECIES: hypothetical protein [Chitinophaga]ASZ10532.1 hypothetical protein CK934_05850 [Chitinophaga sp. MD30]UCJ06495.1 hypothetical protein KTO58_22925 [Chitinophaga pendula]
MRSLFAFLACTAFIVWAHSSDQHIVGVRAQQQQQQELSGMSRDRVPEHVQRAVKPDFYGHIHPASFIKALPLKHLKNHKLSMTEMHYSSRTAIILPVNINSNGLFSY